MSEQSEMASATPPTFNLVVEYDVAIPMRDGVILRADIVRPEAKERFPVILERTPYSKAMLAHILQFNMTALARLGNVCIMQDTRNRFMSDGEGEFTPFVGDREDGADTIAWAADQPFTNGDVFMIGGSYTGLTQWSAATSRAPALRAIAPVASPSTPMRTLAYQGGVLELGGLGAWFMLVGFDTLMKRHAGDGGAMGANLKRLSDDFTALSFGGFDSLPISRFEPIARHDIGAHFFPMLSRDPALPTLAALEQAQAYENIDVPALICVGWYDYFITGSLDQFVGMKARGGTEAARTKTRLVVGPWTHTNNFGAFAGERNFGPGATMDALNPMGISGASLDFYREISSGGELSTPPVRLFVMGANQWRDEQEWPLARTRPTPWYLSSNERANSASDGGSLTPDPLPSSPGIFLYDPANPVPTWGGTNLGMSELSGPRDQSRIERREDVLIYTSQPLGEPLEVTGTVVAELWVTTDAPDTDFIARLVDVEPDGTCWNLADGILRLRYRDDPAGSPSQEPAVPGQPYLLRIALTPTSNLFKAGHRIRIDITSSSFPRWARSLNIWDDSEAVLEDARVARNAVLHDSEHHSRVILPIIPV